MKTAKLAPVVLSVLLFAGCGSTQAEEQASGTAEQASVTVDVSMLREVASGLDYLSYPSPEAIADEAAMVATGVVRTIEDGYTLQPDLGRSVPGSRHRFAVMQVEVSNAFKGSRYTHNGEVYVQLPLGGEAVDESGQPAHASGAPSTVTTVEEVRAAIPAGTRVAVFGFPVNLNQYSLDELSGAAKGRPTGASLMAAKVEGLIFDGGESQGVVGGFVDIPSSWSRGRLLTFDELERRLATATR